MASEVVIHIVEQALRSLGESVRQQIKTLEQQQLANPLHGMAKAQYTSHYTPLTRKSLKPSSGRCRR